MSRIVIEDETMELSEEQCREFVSSQRAELNEVLKVLGYGPPVVEDEQEQILSVGDCGLTMRPVPVKWWEPSLGSGERWNRAIGWMIEGAQSIPATREEPEDVDIFEVGCEVTTKEAVALIAHFDLDQRIDNGMESFYLRNLMKEDSHEC